MTDSRPTLVTHSARAGSPQFPESGGHVVWVSSQSSPRTADFRACCDKKTESKIEFCIDLDCTGLDLTGAVLLAFLCLFVTLPLFLLPRILPLSKMDFTQNQTNGHSEDSTRPLNVTIVGAGIGGLTAAIYLRQQGHTVTLFEQSRFASETGAAVHLAPNAQGLLRRIGIFPEKTGAVEATSLDQRLFNGKRLFVADLVKDAHRWQWPWQLAHRINLHEELKKRATSEQGPGKPAVLNTRSRVVDVDPYEATITLDNGEKIKGDVVVGADGVHSKMRRKVAGAENIETFGSGKSAYRFLISREQALADPETRKYAGKEGELTMFIARDRRVVLYPTSDNTLLNFVCVHPTAESQVEHNAPGSSDWQNTGNIGKMLEVFKSFEPAVLKLLGMADEESLKVWELLDMEKLPSWVEGNLVLIGDAAHPFTPRKLAPYQPAVLRPY